MQSWKFLFSLAAPIPCSGALMCANGNVSSVKPAKDGHDKTGNETVLSSKLKRRLRVFFVLWRRVKCKRAHDMKTSAQEGMTTVITVEAHMVCGSAVIPLPA